MKCLVVLSRRSSYPGLSLSFWIVRAIHVSVVHFFEVNVSIDLLVTEEVRVLLIINSSFTHCRSPPDKNGDCYRKLLGCTYLNSCPFKTLQMKKKLILTLFMEYFVV